MDAEPLLPSCTLRLIGSDFTSPMMRSAINDLWQGLHIDHPIHRHPEPPHVEVPKRDEVWIIASNPAEWAQRVNPGRKAWGCAALFLHERSGDKPLPDLRLFAAGDWIFAPWGPGELVLRIQALASRLQKLPAPTDTAFFTAGSESLHVPMQKAKTAVVSAFERGYLNTILEAHAGNVSAAARSARKHRRAFLALLQKHRIKPDDFRDPNRHADLISKGMATKARLAMDRVKTPLPEN